MASWNEMKAAVAEQMNRDPQRATLALRAIQGVEEGLRHLTSVGWNFEVGPRIAPVTQPEPEPQTHTMTVAEASSHFKKAG